MRHAKEEVLRILKQLDKKPASAFESETLDFKEWISSPKKLYKILTEYAVCFANQKGGTLVLGVKDKVRGKENAITGCVGYNIDEIKSRIYEATDPKILVDVEELYLEDLGVTVLLVHIPEGFAIHTATDGTAKIRLGKECKPLTGSMRTRRMIETGLIDYSANILEGLGISELDEVEIERLRSMIRARHPEHALLKLGKKEFLQQVGIVKRRYLTVAGLLVVGKPEVLQDILPSHEVIYLHLKSDIDYDFRKDYKTCLIHILYELERVIESYNQTLIVKDGLFHYEIKEYPPEVYREAILNALLHRDYTRDEAVFVKHYTDRMEVSNPGSFIGGITPENILRQDSKPRNKHLAEILRKVGLIEKAGMGVKRMFYLQLAHGKEPPLYEIDDHTVRVVLKDGTINEAFVKFVKDMERRGQSLGLDELLILFVLQRRREIALKEASKILQLDESRSREILNKMVAKNLLEKSGIKRGLIYRLSGQVYQKLGEAVTYIRERSVDELRYEELILEYVKRYGEISNSIVRQLLGVDIYKASRVLKKLTNEGKLQRKGAKRNARYVLPD